MSDTEQDHRAGPKVGSRTGFTAIVKVKPGHEQELRELIAADQSKPQTQEALAEIGTLHEFRWAMFDDDRRMIFASSFDGSWVKYVQDFATSKVGAIIDRNLQHCEDWNGIKDPGASENLLSYAVPAVQYESAYPEPSCRQVVKAWALQKAFQQVLNDPAAAEALQHPALKPLLALAAD